MRALWERTSKDVSLLPSAKRTNNFCSPTPDLLNLRIPLEQVIQQRQQQEQQKQHSLQHQNAPTVAPASVARSEPATVAPSRQSSTYAVVDDDDDFQELPSWKHDARNPPQAVPAKSEEDEYLEILDADDELLSAIEVIDDVADTGFASIDRSPKTSASSTAVPAPDPDPNLIDECMDLCDFDDFDIVEAGVAEPISMPAPRPSNASAAAPAHPSTRSAEKLPAPSMGLDATIDLTLDFEDELDSIGMQDLDADFGNESPKRASETWSTDSAPKRPRVAFNTLDTATTSGQLTPVSVPVS
ncbi:hypothetical protein IWW51_005958 [Coemansia sp. RSA 2702]|nr:hypothetical protein IWW51_005958 [Coemansia sp. RSA 2702]